MGYSHDYYMITSHHDAVSRDGRQNHCGQTNTLSYFSHTLKDHFLSFESFKAIRKKERKKCLSLLYTPAASHHLLNPKTIPVISIPPLCCCPTPSFQTFKLKYPQMSSKVYYV